MGRGETEPRPTLPCRNTLSRRSGLPGRLIARVSLKLPAGPSPTGALALCLALEGCVARILVVDDEKEVGEVVSLILRKASHDVETAASADSALQKCRSGTFDLVLSDVKMPNVDGHTLAFCIAALFPSCRMAFMTTPIETDCDKCPYAEHCPVMLKPFDSTKMLAFVSDVLAAPPRQSRKGEL